MLNERGYERETNCSGMLKISSRLLRAQRVHRGRVAYESTLMSLQQHGQTRLH